MPSALIEGVLHLLQAAFGVREGYHGKATEADLMTCSEIGRVFVHSACRLCRRLWVSEPDTWSCKGENSRRDALIVHRRHRLFRSPAKVRGISPTAARSGDPITIFREIKRRDEVMMHIDQTPFRDHGSRRKGPHEVISA